MSYGSNYPTGAEYDPSAPWNRTETIDVHMCKECGTVEVPEFGDLCKECAAIEAGLCCHCYAEPIRNSDSDICAACYADAIEHQHGH